MENKFIIFNRDFIEHFNLEEYVEPIISTLFHQPIGFAS